MRFTSSSSALLAAVAFGTFACASAAPSASDLKDHQPRGPVLPLRPIAQVPFNAPSFIVGGELADSNDSKWAVALVTNTHVSCKPAAQQYEPWPALPLPLCLVMLAPLCRVHASSLVSSPPLPLPVPSVSSSLCTDRPFSKATITHPPHPTHPPPPPHHRAASSNSAAAL